MSFLAPIAGAAARAVGTRVLGGVASRIGASAVGRAIGSRGMLSAAQFAQGQSNTIKVSTEPVSQMLGKNELP